VGEPRRLSVRQSAATPSLAAGVLQTQLAVGAIDDPFEREAERAADAMTAPGWEAMPLGGGMPFAASVMRVVQRAIGKNEPPKTKSDDEERRKQVQKKAIGTGPDTVPAGIESSIRTMAMGGDPIAPSLRSVFEARFGYDFGRVRTHSGADAAGAAVALSARAFTVGDHIYFGAGEYQPDTASGRRLIAHELTHTIQQQPSSARTARLLPASARVQRDWLPNPKAALLEKVRQWADELPPYELLTVLLGRDPITDKPVERSARNWMHAALRLVPDGMAIFEDLEKNKTLETTAEWFGGEIAKLNLTWDTVKALFTRAWDALDAGDILSPRKAWDTKVKPIFEPTLARLKAFALAVGGKILGFIKKTVLAKLAAWAKEQRGYTLLTFVLGKDPVTDEAVARTPRNLVKAVLALVDGGDKIFENLEKTKTIENTVVWLEAEIAKLDLTWDGIKALFRKAWDAFTITDLLHPLTLAGKIVEIFGAPARRVLNFAIAVGKKVLEFIFEGAMLIAGPIGQRIAAIFKKIGATFQVIVADPIAFLGHLVDALKRGFEQFGRNIWEHLKTGLIEWLVGTLEGAGLKLPKVWDLKGIVDLVLQILGITYAKMRAKLVNVIGEERVAMIERVFDFVVALVTEGPVAAWNKIVEAVGSLWDMVIGGIKDWAITKIVTAAITKLATMLNPAGAIIQAIIAIYNTVAFFIERINQILALVEAIVDSIANIAAGKLEQAANFVERAMARTIPVILGFLSRLIGLGDVSGAIKNVITTIQTKVDNAIDKVIAWIVEKAKSLFGKQEEPHDEKWDKAVAAISAEVDAMPDEQADEAIDKKIPDWKKTYGFSELVVVFDKDGEPEIDGAMSPGLKVKKLPSMKPKFGAINGSGYGTSVYVGRITKGVKGGSSPTTAAHTAYDKLNKRRDDTKGTDPYYVRGHLLNDHLGGPGEWKNLTPLSQTANNRGKNSMLHLFENKVKDAVFAGKKVRRFRVEPTQGTVKSSSDLTQIKAAQNAATTAAQKAHWGAVYDVVEEEQFMPRIVVCKAEIDGTMLGPIPVDNDPATVSWKNYEVKP
jgi:Domain of unknown function (DUF4157)/DNA/RNA non-specific endonuclease